MNQIHACKWTIGSGAYKLIGQWFGLILMKITLTLVQFIEGGTGEVPYTIIGSIAGSIVVLGTVSVN